MQHRRERAGGTESGAESSGHPYGDKGSPAPISYGSRTHGPSEWEKQVHRASGVKCREYVPNLRTRHRFLKHDTKGTN